MWLVTEYEAVTLFSLKLSSATASGGKTLLTPTPYAIKMALLDAAYRINGAIQAETQWQILRELDVALRPAKHAVVTNLFQKILRPRRKPVPLSNLDAGPFQKTIGYREYVQLEGSLGIALGWQNRETLPWLEELLWNINYFGKRGGFFQLIRGPDLLEEPPPEFILATRDQREFPIPGMLQILDDCAPGLSLTKANIYSDKNIQLGKDRITRSIVLPYRLVRAARSYTLYERHDQ